MTGRRNAVESARTSDKNNNNDMDTRDRDRADDASYADDIECRKGQDLNRWG